MLSRHRFWLLGVALLFLSGALYASGLHRDEGEIALTDVAVVIDPGHGGRDPGANINGLLEKDITLSVAKILQGQLIRREASVLLTRSGDYAHPNYKKELAERSRLIEKVNPDVLISIHINKFPHPGCFGGQVFYQEGSIKGEKLAEKIQTELIRIQPENRREARSGDYYLLREHPRTPGAVLEIGFISNPIDRQRFQSADEKEAIASAIVAGISSYVAEGYLARNSATD